MLADSYTFTGKMYLWPNGMWYFVDLPISVGDEITEKYSYLKHAWGSLYVVAKVGKTTWNTSIFPYKKIQSYMIPINKQVRTKEKIKEDQVITVTVTIRA